MTQYMDIFTHILYIILCVFVCKNNFCRVICDLTYKILLFVQVYL